MYIMLESIKKQIKNLKNDTTSFSELYMKYVIDVHDESLEKEISYMLKNKIHDVNLVDRAIINSLESLVRLYSDNIY